MIPWAVSHWANYEIVIWVEHELFKRYMNKEHTLCVLNHRGDMDWMIGWCLLEMAGMLGVMWLHP